MEDAFGPTMDGSNENKNIMERIRKNANLKKTCTQMSNAVCLDNPEKNPSTLAFIHALSEHLEDDKWIISMRNEEKFRRI